jgi:hypothetical protein
MPQKDQRSRGRTRAASGLLQHEAQRATRTIETMSTECCAGQPRPIHRPQHQNSPHPCWQHHDTVHACMRCGRQPLAATAAAVGPQKAAYALHHKRHKFQVRCWPLWKRFVQHGVAAAPLRPSLPWHWPVVWPGPSGCGEGVKRRCHSFILRAQVSTHGADHCTVHERGGRATAPPNGQACRTTGCSMVHP